MKKENSNLRYKDKGTWQPGDGATLRLLTRKSPRDAGIKAMPAAARKFASHFSTTVARYPKQRKIPNWLRAMVQKKVSVEELTKTAHDRLHRAPSKENQEFALLIGNEIARMKGGGEMLKKYITPELLGRLRGRGGEEK